MKKILEVKELRTYFYSGGELIKAVDGVSFNVMEGETLGIVGESGCGKTVTGLSLLRLVPKPIGHIVGGRILLEGEDLLEKTEKEMTAIRGARISMILQDPMSSLNPLYRIGDQVAETVETHQHLSREKIREKVVKQLQLVQIPSPAERMKQYPHQMSGGMRQRVVGAIGLACEPVLLIADEPTTSLDVTVQAQYMNLLKEIQRELSMAMIFITHDFGIVARMCDRVVVMYAGKIVEHAPVREIFDNPLHPYTAALMRAIPRKDNIGDRLLSIEGQPPDLGKLGPECAFKDRCESIGEKCRADFPPLVSVSPGHDVACWMAT